MTMRRLRLRALLVLVAALAVLPATGASWSMARFTSTSVDGATVTSGPWAFYLHNRPTPPTVNTAAQVNLAMDTTVPAAVTLYRYSTDCAAQSGRRINTAAPNPNQANVCRYVNWRTAALASPMTLRGAITVDIWSASANSNNNRTGGIVAYLRDFNPAGAGSYAPIANGLYATTYVTRLVFYHYPITVTVATPYTVPAGHQLELKLVASNAYQSNMLVAYDTTTYASFLRIR